VPERRGRFSILNKVPYCYGLPIVWSSPGYAVYRVDVLFERPSNNRGYDGTCSLGRLHRCYQAGQKPP
jgi:hypothetical protein